MIAAAVAEPLLHRLQPCPDDDEHRPDDRVRRRGEEQQQSRDQHDPLDRRPREQGEREVVQPFAKDPTLERVVPDRSRGRDDGKTEREDPQRSGRTPRGALRIGDGGPQLEPRPRRDRREGRDADGSGQLGAGHRVDDTGDDTCRHGDRRAEPRRAVDLTRRTGRQVGEPDADQPRPELDHAKAASRCRCERRTA
jgi:hypothetical protein